MNKLSGRKIALIGGAGFIGHNLALTLNAHGAQVDVVDSLQVNNLLSIASDPKPTNRDLHLSILHERLDLLRNAGIMLHPVDARDYQILNRVLGQVRPQVIVHLAAVAHANRSNKDPYSTFDHSFRTLENALDYSRGNVEQFIYFSSSMVYGNFLSEEVDEDHPLNPIGIYGALKLGGEKLVIAYNQVFDLPYTIVRPSALYGPRCVSRRVAQIFIENALRGEPIQIEGNGTEKLDFTYIDDLVSGICLAIQEPAARNQIFNLTCGKSRSILELVTILRKHFPALVKKNTERDELMPYRGTLNIHKAQELLGYVPSHPLEVGIAKYVAWYQSMQAPVAARKAA